MVFQFKIVLSYTGVKVIHRFRNHASKFEFHVASNRQHRALFW